MPLALGGDVGEGPPPSIRTVIERLLVTLCACALLGCSAHGERFEAPPELTSSSRPSTSSATGRDDAQATDIDARAFDPLTEAELLVRARTRVTSFLGTTHAVVEDAEGSIVAGADEDSSNPEPSQESQLSLRLPAGSGYTLKLSATTSDEHPTTCRASVGPLSVRGGSTARVQVLAWDCGEKVGYVPETLENDCYWLADWAFVDRTSAAVGERIQGGVAASGSARYRWSSPAPELGDFTAQDAARINFRCEAPGEKLTLQVTLSEGGCEQHVTQTVSCF